MNTEFFPSGFFLYVCITQVQTLAQPLPGPYTDLTRGPEPPPKGNPGHQSALARQLPRELLYLVDPILVCFGFVVTSVGGG